jgi:hypothetical protein
LDPLNRRGTQRHGSAASLSMPAREHDNELVQRMNAFALHLLAQLETKAMGKGQNASLQTGNISRHKQQ